MCCSGFHKVLWFVFAVWWFNVQDQCTLSFLNVFLKFYVVKSFQHIVLMQTTFCESFAKFEMFNIKTEISQLFNWKNTYSIIIYFNQNKKISKKRELFLGVKTLIAIIDYLSTDNLYFWTTFYFRSMCFCFFELWKNYFCRYYNKDAPELIKVWFSIEYIFIFPYIINGSIYVMYVERFELFWCFVEFPAFIKTF